MTNFLLNTEKKGNLLKYLKIFLRFFLGLPLTITSFFFIFKFLFQSSSEVINFVSDINIVPFIWGLVFLIFFFLLKSYVWTRLVESKGYKINTLESVFFYSHSELRRYIPLSIIGFATRIEKFNKYEIPRKTLLSLIGKEALILAISSFVISIPGIIYILQLSSTNTLFYYLPLREIAIFGLMSFVFLSALLFYFIHRSKRFTLANIKMFALNNLETFFLSALSWTLFGIGNLLIAVSFYYFSPYAIIPFASFFVLSWLIGYLSFITPMGLGIREGILIYGLSYLSPFSIATTLAIVLRVFLIVSELFFYLVIFLMMRTIKIFKKIHFTSHTPLILLGTIFAYIYYFSYFTFQKHENFFTGRFDLGNMDQTVWNTLHGRFFMLTNPDSTNIVSRLGTHADFILILLTPFYILWSDPRILLLIQTIVIGFGAWFVYLIGKEVIKSEKLSFVLSLSYLLNPFVQRQNLYDFHPVTLATTFLLASFYFMHKKRNLLFLIFLGLSVMTKENIYLISGLFGFFLYFKGRRNLGAIISLFSFAIFYLLVSKFIPDVRGGEHFAVSYFQEFGDSPIQILKGLILRPNITFTQVFTYANFDYFVKLFSATGFTSLAFPFPLLLALPDLIINFLSKNANFKSITFHYAAAIIPFIYISSIYGVKKILGIRFKYFNKNTIFYYILFSSLLSAWLYGPLPGSNHPAVEIFSSSLKEKKEVLNFLSKIPRSLSISASNNLGAHLSHREKIYTVPNGIDKADMVLFLLNDPFAQPSPNEQTRMVKDLGNDKNYIQVARFGSFIAFERKNLSTTKKLVRRKPEIYPYSIPTLQKRSYQKGQINYEKTLKENKNSTTYLISYLSDGYKIYSLLSVPYVRNFNTPILIIFHKSEKTFDSQKSLFGLVNRLSSQGFIVLRPDFRGYGMSEGDKSGIESLSYPVDVVNLMYSLDTQEKIVGNKFHFWGEGDGAEVILKTLEIAGRNDGLASKIDKSVLINPLYDITANTAFEKIQKNKELINLIGPISVDNKQWEDLNPKNYVDFIKSELLIIETSGDASSLAQSQELYDALASNNQKVYLSNVFKENNAKIADFAASYLEDKKNSKITNSSQ